MFTINRNHTSFIQITCAPNPPQRNHRNLPLSHHHQDIRNIPRFIGHTRTGKKAGGWNALFYTPITAHLLRSQSRGTNNEGKKKLTLSICKNDCDCVNSNKRELRDLCACTCASERQNCRAGLLIACERAGPAATGGVGTAERGKRDGPPPPRRRNAADGEDERFGDSAMGVGFSFGGSDEELYRFFVGFSVCLNEDIHVFGTWISENTCIIALFVFFFLQICWYRMSLVHVTLKYNVNDTGT